MLEKPERRRGNWRNVDRGPRWGAKKGQRIPGAGKKPRSAEYGTAVQLDRQFKAFEFHVRSFSNKEIAELLKCNVNTIVRDIKFEFERRRAVYAGGREEFIQRNFHALEAVKQMNFEVLTKNFGESKSGHEYKAIIAAILAQSRLMGYDAPKRVDARIDGQIDVAHLGLSEVTGQLPEGVSTALLYAIAEAAGYGGDSRLGTPERGLGTAALGANEGAIEYIGPTGEVDIIEHGAGNDDGMGAQATR